MSIEDPRLSSIDNTSAADDFDSAVEQHLGFSGEAADGFELAQAQTPETGRTDRLPAPTPPVQTAAATIPTEVTPNADNVVTLPAGIELDNLEFQVDGENLVIVLADGTEIVVIGGAANIPTFVIGDVELPQVALFAALEGSNINIAAGPDGTFAAQGTPEASRNFQDDPIDAGPEQFALADLLGNTDFGDGIQSAEETGDNPTDTVPLFGPADEGFVDEDYLDDKIIDGGEGERSFDTAASIGTTAEGSLGIVWGNDDDNAIENGGLTGSAGDRGVAFTQEDTIAALTEQNYKSDGRPLIYVLSDNDTTLTAYQDEGGGILGDAVFRVSVSDVSPNGSYEFELLGNLDHPDTSKEDDITIEFEFAAQDSNGDQGTSSFTVTVNDDSPVQGEAGIDSLTEDDVSEYCATDATSADATTTNAISLGISWGADNDTRGEGDEVGRTVHFVVTDEDGDTGGDGPADQLRAADTTDVTLFTDPASIGLSITGGTFTSGGNVLSYRLTDTVTGGQILTAFYVSTDGEVEREVDVFQIVLDPLTYNGSATVTIFEELDHDLGSSAPIIIDFQFQATDSDGDAALPGTASVTIADDELVVLGPKWPGFVEEEALDGGNEDIRPILVESVGFLANQGAIDKTISKSLWIQWGADDSNRVENGGYTLGQTAGDRSVVFDLSSEVATPSSTSQVVQSDNVSLTLEEVASFMSVSGKYGTIDLEDLTSGEAELIYELTDNGTVLTAYTGSGEDRADVFRVTLSDLDDGSYTFELLGVLDHPGKAEGAQNEDVLSFTFDFIARDADGDSDGSSFTVKIIDDCPVASAVTGEAINEALGEDGEFLQVTTTGTLSFLAGADGATVTGISYGLKNQAGTAFFVEEPYESRRDPSSQPQLTSNSRPITVTSLDEGLTLEGRDSEGTLVFTLKVTDPATGAYEFKLLAPIDQPDVDQGGTDDVVRLVFNFTVTDGDGDRATNTLKIEVRDSVPLAANDDGGTVRESAPTPGGNLILAFDVSGSMNSEAVTGDGVSQSRLELAKAAALELLAESTAEYVRIVTFSGSASSSVWMTRGEAIAYIQDPDNIDQGRQNTNYDNALAAIRSDDALTPGSTVYFFSDGGSNSGQISSAEATAWEEYLSDRGMTSYAVGVGTRLNDNNDDLGDVAWPGTPITITSADDSDLLDTVPTGTALPTTTSGNVVTNDSFGADGPGYVKSITVGGVTYSFDGANEITVSGANAPAIEGKEITVTSPLGGTLTFNFETGAWNYSAPSDMPATANETFAYTLVDADGDTSPASLTINVQAVNDAPVNSVPSSLTAVEDEFLTINNLSVGDVDAGQADITVKLEVKNGTLTLATTAGLTDFPGNGTSTVTLTGSVAEINDALRGLKYKGLQDFNGTDQLKITTIDNGNTGIGGAKTDVDTVNITVTAVNDAPVNTVPSSQRVGEDEVLTFRGLSVGDVDANGSDITVTLEVEHGKLTLAKTSGMRVEGNNSGIVTLTGSVSEINAALNGLKYQGSKDFNGSDQLKITTSDNGNSGAGGIQTDIDTVNITVTSVNDNPEFNGGSQRSFSVDENTTAVGSVSATDVDSPTLTYSIVESRDTDWQKFKIDPSSGAITFKTAPNFENPTDGNWNNKYWVEVEVSDGLGGVDRQMIEIDVKNVNENPVLNAVEAIRYTDTATDNTFRNATGTLVASDVDFGDSKVFGIDGGNVNGNVVTRAGAYGTLSLNVVSGAYTYAPNDGAIEGLKTTDQEQFIFTVTDRAGAKSEQVLTINLTGANDTADIGGNFTGTVAEDGTQQTASGQLTVTDRDTGDIGFQAPTSLAGIYGDFTFNSTTGQWAYALRNSDANVQALKAGDVVHDRLTVLSKDGSDSQVIDVTINGANERPTISASTPAELVEAGYQQAGVATSSSTLTLGDVDGTVSYDSAVLTPNGWSNNNGTWTKAGLYGVATLNPGTNQITYTLNNSLANGLKPTDHPVEVFAVPVKDNNNATASVNVSFVINGTNDAPVASVDNVITNAGAGNQFSVAKWALLQNDTDAEGDALDLSVQSPSGLTASASGQNVTVTDDNVNGGSFTYKASDGPALSAAATVSVTQQTGALVGTAGSDIMVAVAKPVGQVTTITFASSYDVGDVVSIKVDGTTYSHRVISGGTSAEAVYDALKDVIGNRLDAKGVRWADNLNNSNAVTLTSSPGTANAFSIEASTDNSNDTGAKWKYTVDFPYQSYFHTSGEVGLYIGGKLEVGNANNSNAQTYDDIFDNAAQSLAFKLSTGGLTVTYVKATNTFEIESNTQLNNLQGRARTWNKDDFSYHNAALVQTGGSPRDQLDPTVATTSASDGGITINGNDGDDILFGSTAADILVGGLGKDILTGGTGNDTFQWQSGLTLSVANADKITDYQTNEKLDVSALLTSGVPLSGYVKVVIEGADLVVKLDTNGGGNSYVEAYRLVGAAASGSGVTSVNVYYNGTDHNIPVANWLTGSDPIILDLDHNGFALSSIDNGVTFDINADGKADQIAWTSDDGILAYDVDGNGVIDNGSEIFTPDFNGGKFASGVAALASLDGNGDGKIDGSDTAFGELKVWIDANNNGISDEGELSSLSDHGVTSISLTTDQTGGEEDGQTIFAEGEFTFEDGSTGNFVEVGFDTIFGSEPEGLTLHGGMGEVVMTGSAGADTFVFDGTALDDIDVADVITDFSSEEGDVLDVTALLDSLLGEQPDATVETHLRATVDGGNTTVSVQTDANVWKDVVVLQNHDTAIKVLFDDQHATVTPHHD